MESELLQVNGVFSSEQMNLPQPILGDKMSYFPAIHSPSPLPTQLWGMCSNGTQRPGHFLLCLFYKIHCPEKNGGCSGNIKGIGDGCKTMEMFLMPLNCNLKKKWLIGKFLCCVYFITI